MWGASAACKEGLGALLACRTEVNDWLLLTALGMIACIAFLGGRWEIADTSGVEISPSPRTLRQLYQLGLLWSILLVVAYIPTQVQYLRLARKQADTDAPIQKMSSRKGDLEMRKVMAEIDDLLDILSKPERVSTIISDELSALRQEFGQTFLIVTHNEELAGLSDRTLHMKDGRIV